MENDNIAIKNSIRASFDRAWQTYDDYCTVQQTTATHLLEVLLTQSRHYDTVADFACGTGINTQLLMEHIPLYSRLYAIDFSPKLLAVAENKHKEAKMQYILSDFDISLFPQCHLDLIFCNMGLQWSLDLTHTLKLFHTYLNDEGIIAFSMPLCGTFPELKPPYKNTCHSVDYIQQLLAKLQFELLYFDQKVEVKPYAHALDAIKSIRAVGANCFIDKCPNQPPKGILPKRYVKEMFVCQDQDTVSLTYHLGIFLARKTSLH